MKPQTNAVLALYPNGRGYGYALFDTPHNLLACGVRTVRPFDSKKYIKRIEKDFADYKPAVILLQDTKAKDSKRGKRIQDLMEEVGALALRHNLEVRYFSVEQIRVVFLDHKVETRFERAQAIYRWLKAYKHMLPIYRKPWKNEHYNSAVFDAISLALTHFDYKIVYS